MSNEKILELAQLHEDDVELGGVKIYLREPGALDMLEYKALSTDTTNKKGEVIKRGDKAGGMALLIQRCCFSDEVRTVPSFTEPEAMKIARGSGRVALPLLNRLLQWIKTDDEEDEKRPNSGAPSESSSSN